MKTKSGPLFIEVAPAIPLHATARQTFTYRALTSPQKQQVIKVPFGRYTTTGVVVEIHSKAPTYPTKDATIDEKNPILTIGQMKLARWIAKTMHGGLGYTLRLFAPPQGKEVVVSTQNKEKKIKLPSSHIQKALTKGWKNHQAISVVESDTAKRHTIIAQAVARCVHRGQQAYIIVPELHLIPSVVEALKEYVPASQVAALATNVGKKEQREIWYGIQNKRLAVIVGTQKGFFLPWQNLQLIIVEQAYYPTHKLWDQYPRLHNVHVAPIMADVYEAHLLYASSIPSLHMYYRDSEGDIPIVHSHSTPPKIVIISKSEHDKQERHLLPTYFLRQLQTWHRQGQRVLVLYNKKGAWQIVACRNCHKAVACPNCGTPFTVHQAKSHGPKKVYTLRCRQCGHEESKPATCPTCHKPALRLIKPGIETISKIINSLRIKTTIIDANQKTGVSKKELAQAKFIIGTQAVFTALAGLTIDRVIWLHPEDTLQYPDVRSNEHTHYTLARLHELAPHHPVTLVTRLPHIVEEIVKLPLTTMWQREIKTRRQLSYPPTKEVVRLTIADSNQKKAVARATHIRLQLDERIKAASLPVRVLGPFAGFTVQERDHYHIHIALFGPHQDLTPLYQDLVFDTAEYMPERIL